MGLGIFSSGLPHLRDAERRVAMMESPYTAWQGLFRFGLPVREPGGIAMLRRTGIVSMTCLGVLLFGGATAPQSCTANTQPTNIGPSTGQVVGAAVAVVGVVVLGTVVLVEVHESHHTIKGCVMAAPGGLQVEDMNNGRVYNVSGVTANVKVGDVVKLHGDKEKKAKGETSQGFVIQKINKDYGACKAAAVQAAATTMP